jgi:crotonobetainyl-CoA:carnitine CoA-transferase CaiB-like acyl-CoA transferase
MDWLNPGRWLLYAAFIGALLLGYNAWADHQQGIGEARANTKWQQATDKLKTEARDKLAAETAKADKATDELRKFKDAQELKDAQARKTVADLRQRLAAVPGGRLRDPNAPGCGSGGSGPQAKDSPGTQHSDPDGTQAGGLLSAELTGLLQRLQSEADEINIAYAACRPDARALRQQLNN